MEELIFMSDALIIAQYYSTPSGCSVTNTKKETAVTLLCRKSASKASYQEILVKTLRPSV